MASGVILPVILLGISSATHGFIRFGGNVQEMKIRHEALEPWRMVYTDLISLALEKALLLAKNKSMNIQTPSFCTRLRLLDGSGFLVNTEPLGNWTMLSSCPTRPFLCGARQTGADVWENSNCGKKLNFICYNKKSF